MRVHGTAKASKVVLFFFGQDNKLWARFPTDLPRMTSRVVLAECLLKGVLHELKMAES